jgi:hypothetical protein
LPAAAASGICGQGSFGLVLAAREGIRLAGSTTCREDKMKKLLTALFAGLFAISMTAPVVAAEKKDAKKMEKKADGKKAETKKKSDGKKKQK